MISELKIYLKESESTPKKYSNFEPFGLHIIYFFCYDVAKHSPWSILLKCSFRFCWYLYTRSQEETNGY